jgi:hypothetical protein
MLRSVEPIEVEVSSLASVSIPVAYRPAFATVLALPDAQMLSLQEALATAAPAAYATLLARRLSDQLPDVPSRDLDDLLNALSGALGLLPTDRPTEELAQDLAESPDLDLSPDERLALRIRLTTLLSSQVLQLTAKATDLLTSGERLFVSVRVVSDIRPVFPRIGTASPAASVLIHKLRIEYLENGEVRSFMIDLDGSDIAKMQSALSRAADKDESLGAFTDRSGFPEITVETVGGS